MSETRTTTDRAGIRRRAGRHGGTGLDEMGREVRLHDPDGRFDPSVAHAAVRG